MESALADSALEIAIIGGLTAIIVTFITLGGTFVFRLLNRVDKLTDDLGENNARISETGTDLSAKIGQTHRELDEKIDYSHRDLSAKIDQTRRELDEKIDARHREVNEKIDRYHLDMMQQMDRLRTDMMQQMDQVKTEILSALVNHSHPEPGGPPVFTAPPPNIPLDPTTREPEATPADN